ncbi:TetR/AcrR family transcriptional regulator [Photobacterium sp. TY1-4]|uniref:TetR/AcrR family transcriptional regulator n=1 Tax=Photobacterium sp. TY1-4 TaxID=2899122 RepID=UPI0021BF3046|nr:TetR/AcrR family transcriptional regulator [Photobacterium sp. TY1-4]UXI02373.1 TetR/AcrR family transcriptional regulator [Photobacterium sp. TY1-4]
MTNHTTANTNAAETPQRQRTRAPHTRRAALMDAAEHLFLTQGVRATRIEDIAAAAQVAKGTFYIYFKSRDALLRALQQRFMVSFCEQIDTALAHCPPDDWESQLRTWFATALDGLLGQILRHDMLFEDVRPSEDRQLMADNPVIEQLCALLQSGVQANAWQTPDPRMTALMIFHAMHGLANEALAQGNAGHRAPLVDMLTDTFGKALRR